MLGMSTGLHHPILELNSLSQITLLPCLVTVTDQRMAKLHYGNTSHNLVDFVSDMMVVSGIHGCILGNFHRPPLSTQFKYVMLRKSIPFKKKSKLGPLPP